MNITDDWGGHLFVPANHAGYLTNLPLFGVRSIIIDVEYATPLEFKHDGRLLAANAIQYLRQLMAVAGIQIGVRVNMPRVWSILQADLDAIVPAMPDCLRIPAVEFPEQIVKVAAYLDELEACYDIPSPIALHTMIETPAGLAHIDAIATASPRITALAFGGEDWAHNCGSQRTSQGTELEYPRQVMVAAAAQAGIAAVDTVYNWLDDEDGFVADCHHSRQMGFHGRATINPRQLPAIQQIYQPSASQVEWASNLLSELTTCVAQDESFAVSRGIVLDPLAVAQAQRILACTGK